MQKQDTDFRAQTPEISKNPVQNQDRVGAGGGIRTHEGLCHGVLADFYYHSVGTTVWIALSVVITVEFVSLASDVIRESK